MSTDLILYQEKISQKRAKQLFKEFKHAWDKCSNKEKFRWCKDTIILFGKVTFRRGKGLLNFTKNVFKSTGKGISNFGKAINENQTKDYLSLQKNKLISGTQSIYKTSRKVLKNTLTILKNNPKQSGPILFLGVLGFFCGAGFQVGEKAFYDIDGGIPDLDIAIGGIGAHRSPLTHSIIVAAVIETMVFSTVRAAHMIYKHLPERHDLFWDGIDTFGEWGTAFASGACTGIAYHLLIDGTLDGGKSMNGLPFSMPIEGHNAIFMGNAAAEAIDLNRKTQVVVCTQCSSKYKVPNMGTGTNIIVNCKSCRNKFNVELV